MLIQNNFINNCINLPLFRGEIEWKSLAFEHRGGGRKLWLRPSMDIDKRLSRAFLFPQFFNFVTVGPVRKYAKIMQTKSYAIFFQKILKKMNVIF